MTVTHRGGSTTFATPTDREIVITRVVDAPRELVFEMWTSCEHLPRWMGPAVMEMTGCRVDLREGGSWRFEWRGPDGFELGMSGVYKEIAPPERLVSTEMMGGYSDELLSTLMLTEEDGITTIANTVLCPSKEIRDAMLASGMEDGVAEGFERMDEYLRELSR